MLENKKIKTALVSVFHKDGLDEILKLLHAEGVEFISTGGTQSFIESLGIPCGAVEDLTGYPSILGGRVKTLHPKVFGGILNRRENETDQQQIAQYEIPSIDLVIVDLYPFEETVASGADESAIIEKIDIGGISLIRAAAKNYKDVVIVASKAQYAPLLSLLKEKGANTSLEDRRWFAKEAFAVSSGYDSAIFNYFDGGEGSAFRYAGNHAKVLRYGENPHQKGVFYGNFDEMFEQLHGKEISYNNLLDIDAAVSLISEFDETTFAILKHNNAVYSSPTVLSTRLRPKRCTKSSSRYVSPRLMIPRPSPYWNRRKTASCSCRNPSRLLPVSSARCSTACWYKTATSIARNPRSCVR